MIATVLLNNVSSDRSDHMETSLKGYVDTPLPFPYRCVHITFMGSA